MRATSDAAKKAVAAGKVVASVGARKAGQTGKQAAKASRRLAQSAADSVERSARSVKHRLDPDGTRPPKLVALEGLPEDTKVGYLQTLVWLTFQDDSRIDPREFSDLHLLMVQAACAAESRRAVRYAIEDPNRLAAEELVARLREQADSEKQWAAIACSLVKDAIRLDRSVSVKGERRHERGIQRLADLLEVTDDQIAFIENACDLDRKILNGELSEAGIKRVAKDLAAKATAAGVPVAAIYLSGSVTGLSAAGITSGLATLGLGGVLGLSSMVTGVGVAVVGGVFVYRSMRWLTSGTGRQTAHRRELMLQDVLLTHRKAIANLAEDMANYAERLVRLTAKADMNRATIEKLSREMTLLGRALGRLRSKEGLYEEALKRASEEQSDEEGDDPSPPPPLPAATTTPPPPPSPREPDE